MRYSKRENNGIFKMSRKADSYVGLPLWLLAINCLWLQNDDYGGWLSITYGWGFPEDQSIIWTSIHWLLTGFIRIIYQWTNVFCWVSLIIAIYSGWKLKHIPMKIIRRMAKTFDKYV
tara:strand:- start:55 stop:405 length:351 start_codon:yes stop_codon:yes gene_type:complete